MFLMKSKVEEKLDILPWKETAVMPTYKNTYDKKRITATLHGKLWRENF